MSIKEGLKVPVNNITHSVRVSQAVLQYGVGAMVDFPDQTLMTAAPEYWKENVVKINDERLEKLLHVDYFGMPGGKDELRYKEGISYARFPKWYFCPKCRKFQPIEKWVDDYRRKASSKVTEYDQHMVKYMKCPTCYQNLVVARIVTVCEHGHIDDFPWIKWVHRKNMNGVKEVCNNPDLRFKTGASASEGLEGLIVTCENCSAKATLKDSFDKDIFSKLDEKGDNTDFKCSGYHPWKNEYTNCGKYPRAIQRGSSSVYFPVVASSLVIPPYSDKLNTCIETSISFQEFRSTLTNIPQELRQIVIKGKISDWAHSIAIEIGIPYESVFTILQRKWCNIEEEEYSTLSVKYRAEEYEALNGTMSMSGNDTADFIREQTDISKYNIPYVTNISLIHKVREVQALTGFSRLEPIEKLSDAKENPNFVSIKEPNTKWYPAYEVRGEGIFIEFNQDEIDSWVTNNEEVQNRVDELNIKYNNSFIGKSNPRLITAKFLLLHTISHLLIKQLSFECGYSIASLKERIYCSEENDGKRMGGIFIYTASGDSEGTMGGLVRQGRYDCFGNIYKKAVYGALVCSNDPVCILSKGQGRDSLNLAACHACTLIPETSCEEYNIFLDRAVVVGTFDNQELGFFSKELYDERIGWKNTHIVSETDNLNYTLEKHLIYFESGVDFSDMSYSDIWNEMLKWSDAEKERILYKEMLSQVEIFVNCEKPISDGKVRVIESGEELVVDLIWKNSKVLFFTTENESSYEVAKLSDWKCFCATREKIEAIMIYDALKE